jgi:hypothetical protein
MWQYLEAQLALAHLPVAPVHRGLRTLVTFGPEHVHGLRQLTTQSRLIRVMQRPHLQHNTTQHKSLRSGPDFDGLNHVFAAKRTEDPYSQTVSTLQHKN